MRIFENNNNNQNQSQGNQSQDDDPFDDLAARIDAGEIASNIELRVNVDQVETGQSQAAQDNANNN